MSDSDRKVRVFISSTFRDMHAERDHLVTVVFPELRERCERLGLEFFDVDLRWGVPEKGVDGESANSWEYCRKWINEAKPFFICLLGQRYGWEPEPHQLKDETDQQAQAADRRSITDMEVHHALENDAHSRRCYFYLRQALAPAIATEFVDPLPLLVKLDALKARVETCGRPVWHYPCRWTGSGFADMEAFGKKVLEDLWSGILRDPRYVSEDAWQQVLGADPAKDSRYTDESQPVPDDLAEKLIPLAKPPPKNPLEAERDEMQRFADSRLRWFQGREQELKELLQFIANPAEAHDSPRLAVLAAQPGQGKSALMAKLSESLHHSAFDIPHSPFVVTHFVGATAQSSSSYHLVKRLLDELESKRSGIPFPEPPQPEGQPREVPKLDFNSLCLRLSEHLRDYDGERRIVLLLDALNQLDDGHDLGWLPYRIGPGVRIVVSCIDDPSSAKDSLEQKVLTALHARFPKPKFIPLGGLDAADVRTIVEGYLLEYCKQLDAPHVDAICAMSQARNPLYLLVMLAELRTLGGNDMNQIVPELIAGMATTHPDTVSLFKWVLKRMEAAEGFGAAGTGWWCLYLAIGRAGMASRELADLLARKLGPDGDATALRIERGLRRYLQRRGETLDVFHGQLRLAVFESYGHEESIREAHRAIADYFRLLADPSQDKQWQGEQQRPFTEIAFHLIGAQQWDDLCDYLTDFSCLDIRIRAGQVFEVVTDQRVALAVLPELADEASRERERVEICRKYGAAMIAYARDCAARNRPPLPEPPDASGLAETGSASGEVSPRADRLRAIANFTAEKASWLAAHPKDFLPVAANATADGPLNDAAATLDTLGVPWLQRSVRPPTPPLRPQCLSTLHGHSYSVNSVALSSDGSRALSGSSDHSLRLWDLATGQCLHTLQGHTNSVTSVALSPDGSRALSGSNDTTLRLWDLATGQCLHTLQGHTNPVTSVALSPDGSRALSGSYDHSLRLWDLATGQCFHILHGHSYSVTSVAISPDGSRALSGSDDTTLRLWSGQCLLTLQGHTGKVTSVALSPDGSRALSAGGYDNTLRLWDLASGQCLHTLQGHTGSVNSVAISPDGSRAVSGSWDNTLRLWDLASGQCLLTLQGDTGSVTSVAISPDGSRALSGSDDATLRLWDLASGQCLLTLEGHTDQVTSVALSPDRSRALSGSWDHTPRLWDLATGQCLLTLQGHTSVVFSVALSPDGSRALSGSDDTTLRLWDLATGQCLHTLQGHTDRVLSVALSPDGSRALSGSKDHNLRLWDLATGQCLLTLQGDTGSVTSVAISPDGSRALSGSDDATLRLWDLASGQCLLTLEGHTDQVTSVALSPDGSRALSAGGYDNTLRLWDLASGQCLLTLQGHTDPVTSVALSPDRSRALSGSNDTTLRLWDLASGQCLAIYQAGAAVTSIAVSFSDGRIVCGTFDGQMHFLTMRNFPELGIRN
ncbi:MAG: DUF4062 domain-containing protein [Verrucomicrobiales bacterium]|nr:DUF4062 domain-containing protein [Verrucomicrobiales bacterium]